MEDISPEHVQMARRFHLSGTGPTDHSTALAKLRSKSSSPIIRRTDETHGLPKSKISANKKRKANLKVDKTSLDLMAALVGDDSTLQHTQSNVNMLNK